jgi:hypothetical protein
MAGMEKGKHKATNSKLALRAFLIMFVVAGLLAILAGCWVAVYAMFTVPAPKFEPKRPLRYLSTCDTASARC